MSELIKREDAIKATWHEPSYIDPYNILTEVRDRIEALPTIDAVPVVHGEWVEKWRFKPNGNPYHKVGDMECSVCHSDMLGRYYSKYCPHCGAKMRIVTDCHTLEEGER